MTVEAIRELTRRLTAVIAASALCDYAEFEEESLVELLCAKGEDSYEARRRVRKLLHRKETA